jgi:hypothetical protein
MVGREETLAAVWGLQGAPVPAAALTPWLLLVEVEVEVQVPVRLWVLHPRVDQEVGQPAMALSQGKAQLGWAMLEEFQCRGMEGAVEATQR